MRCFAAWAVYHLYWWYKSRCKCLYGTVLQQGKIKALHPQQMQGKRKTPPAWSGLRILLVLYKHTLCYIVAVIVFICPFQSTLLWFGRALGCICAPRRDRGSYYNPRHNFYTCNLHKAALLCLVFLCLSCRIPLSFFAIIPRYKPIIQDLQKVFLPFRAGAGLLCGAAPLKCPGGSFAGLKPRRKEPEEEQDTR